MQRCEACKVGSTEMLRVLKPRGRIVMGEIATGPCLAEMSKIDMHHEYYVRKLCTGANQVPEDCSCRRLDRIGAAFAGKLIDGVRTQSADPKCSGDASRRDAFDQ